MLDLLGLEKKPGQVMDGVSLAPVLTGAATAVREEFFNFFPSQQNGGGVTVVRGAHKLIRWFAPGVPRELYDLEKDINETTNMAERMPDKARELDARIDAFLKETGALFPRPNPAYQPRPDGAAAAAARPLGGWVPKGCVVEQRGRAMIVTGENRNPFLGKTNLKLKGPVTVVLQTRGQGGPGKIQWRAQEQETFPPDGQTVEFTLPDTADQHAETVVTLPAESVQHVRLYLPAQNAPVTLEKVELRGR